MHVPAKDKGMMSKDLERGSEGQLSCHYRIDLHGLAVEMLSDPIESRF